MRRGVRYLRNFVVALVVIVVCVVGGVWLFSQYRFSKKHDVALRPVPVNHDSATVARGHHYATAISKCVYCHGSDLGGQIFVDDPALGRVVAPNLTSGQGSRLADYSDAQLARAIRYGVALDGRGLLVMPSEDFVGLSDEDVGAIVAYLRSLPPINRTLPASNVKLLTRVLYATGQFPILSIEKIGNAPQAPALTPTADSMAYGQYLANAGGCTGCHGPGLSGGKIPGTPPEWKPAANITPTGIGTWTEADFVRALREGIRPAGTPIDTIMPWKLAKDMTNEEMHALWVYIRSVPPRPFGNR